MRKQELVFLHGLLVQVREFYERQTSESVPTPAYEQLDVRPTSIHLGKPIHEAAVLTLAAELADGMGTAPHQVHVD